MRFGLLNRIRYNEQGKNDPGYNEKEPKQDAQPEFAIDLTLVKIYGQWR
jgi:hypothetical protein